MQLPFRAWLFTIFIANWSVTNCQAQNTFSKRYNFNIPGDIFSSVVVVGDSIYATGVSGDTSNNNAELWRPKNLSAVFDLRGNLVRNQVYNGEFRKGYETFAPALIKTSNGFAMCGSAFDTTGRDRALVIKYDSLLQVSDIKEYTFPDSLRILRENSIAELAGGELLVAGFVQWVADPGDCSPTLLKVDSLGNIIWWKTYPSHALINISQIIVPLDSNHLLIGYERTNEAYGPLEVHAHTEFTEVDTGGNIITQWEDPNDSTFAPFGLLKTMDGGYAYCGRYKNRMSAPYDIVLTDAVFTKLDSAFNLRWRRRYRTAPDGVDEAIFNQLHQASDGSLIMVGQGQKFDSILHHYSMVGYVNKLTGNGDSIWARTYKVVPNGTVADFYDADYLYDFKLLPDGGLIACGQSIYNPDAPYGQQAWLIRLDSMGCVIPGCDTLTTTGAQQPGDVQIGVKLYPNPANNLAYLLIKADEPVAGLWYRIYDTNGKLLTTENGLLDVTYIINTQTFPAGLYLIEVGTGRKVLATRKLVKE